jgi:uncharacterized protein (TIGR00369 family)
MSPEERTAYFTLLRDQFHEAPITRHVPQEMEIDESGEVRIVLRHDPRLHHGAARVHGGVLGLVLDNVGFFAAATVSDGLWVATTEYKVHLLEPVGADDVIAVGRVLRKGRHIVHTEMKASTRKGAQVAVGMGTYAILPRPFRASRRPAADAS